MQLIFTLNELSEKYNWDKVCEVLDLDYYCLNEGTASGDDKISITLEQAKEIGIDPTNL